MTFDGPAFHRAIAKALGVETQTAVALQLGVTKHRWNQALRSGKTALPTLIRYAEQAGAVDLAERLRAVHADQEQTREVLAKALEAEVNDAIAASLDETSA